MTTAEAYAAPVGALSSDWLKRPLCRRYVLAVFHAAVVRCRDAEGCHDRRVHWAFGWLADGDCEPLGAWMEPGTGSDGLRPMLADLQRRGVERIAHVTSTDRAALPERFAAERAAESLERAVRRHGSFESDAAVLDFVAGALQRMERRSDRGGVKVKVSAPRDAGAHRVPLGI
jgi:hypothetical protein